VKQEEIILVAVRLLASDMLTKQALAKAMNGWREHGKYINSLDFHDNVNIYRHTSYSQGLGHRAAMGLLPPREFNGVNSAHESEAAHFCTLKVTSSRKT